MLDSILKNYELCNYDFRLNAYAKDPLTHLFSDWVDYYRMKWAIAKTIQPKKILEIGIRYGYSARAFLEASPQAQFTGIDADSTTFGGEQGAVDWAAASLSKQFEVHMIKTNSLNLSKFPGELYDLIHIDGQQDGDGTFHDLNMASLQARYILVDGFFWSKDNFAAANEWLFLNKAAVEAVVVIPGYAGEMLIRTKTKDAKVANASTSEPLAQSYTAEYYLNDCGGHEHWKRSRGKFVDPRLQAVADVGMALCNPKKVVDLGAGRGELTRLFAERGVHVTAIDYSEDAVKIIEKTLDGKFKENVSIACDSVLNPKVYSDNYDLAVASDIVEHLSPEEDDALYALVSEKLKPTNGTLVVHTAPNLWMYRYEHSRQQKAAIQAGFWLPKVRRTWYERLMHVNEQSPRVLKRQLSAHFPHVLLWFTDEQGMGGSLLRHFNIADMRRAHSLFAVASHTPIDREKLVNSMRMMPLDEEQANAVSLRIQTCPNQVQASRLFAVEIELINKSSSRLASLQPHPIHLSYHWFDQDGRSIVFDGLRSALESPLSSNASATFSVQIKAPDSKGQFTLCILPVQEGVRWHESTDALSKRTIVVSNVI
jgi:2-polyprenyl-3-methyl-5-hydroxy-6-metoxy-1,4-benzoquinol methylase